MVIASLVACRSPAGQQILSKVGEAGHGGRPLYECLEGVITEDVIAMISYPPFLAGCGPGWQEGNETVVGHLEPLCLPSLLSLLPPPQSSFPLSSSADFLPLPS